MKCVFHEYWVETTKSDSWSIWSGGIVAARGRWSVVAVQQPLNTNKKGAWPPIYRISCSTISIATELASSSCANILNVSARVAPSTKW